MLAVWLGCLAQPGDSAAEAERGSRPDDEERADTDVPGDTEEPAEESFTCSVSAPGSPQLATQVRWDPSEPHPGDTVTVTVLATDGTGREDAPEMSLTVEGADGTRTLDPQAVEGGAALYYFAISDVQEGELCLSGSVSGSPEWAAELEVTPRTEAHDTTGGIYKVVQHHQWSCSEQPECGNYIYVTVLDAAGNGVPNATVRIDMPDTTVHPIYNDTTPSSIPETVTTDDDGQFVGQNSWPTNENGLQVFQLSVDGHASDVATEITTGWWEDDLAGCSYCSTYCVNVWGHWSYSVTFQLDPAAAEICEVPSDHGGMSACGEPRHIHHDPDHMACYAP